MSSGCNPITRDDMPYIRWIHTIFGLCIYSNQKAIISDIFGYLSIACWFNAQIPQLITNYRNSSADGLSLPFLTNWLLGDIANLLGCILTNQLPFQIYLAVYFCFVDFVLFFQYFYYSWFQPSTDEIVYDSSPCEYEIPERSSSYMQTFKDSIMEGAKKSYTFPARKNQSHQRISSMVFAVLLFTFNSTSSISSSFSTTSHFSNIRDETELREMSFGGNTKVFFERNVMFIGRVMAWTCTVLYLTSRLPQIWKNYTRSSVEGLSVMMFVFAALGNLTYTISIFTNPTQSYIREAIPYILGSVGTLTFDITIFIQWCIWRDAEPRKRRRSVYSGSYNRLSDDGGYGSRRYRRSGRYNRRSVIDDV